MFKRLILLSGPVGAGKSTIAGLLADRYGIHTIKTRSLLLGLTPAKDRRDDLQRAGERLDRRTNGKWLAAALAREAERYDDNVEVVVDSVRIGRQIDEIRTTFGVPAIHLHLTASRATLAKRYAERRKHQNGEEGFRTYEDVRANRTERQIGQLESTADVVINTDRNSIDDVFVRVASHLGYFGRHLEQLVDVLVGGQYGSEGKGNVASYLAPEYDIPPVPIISETTSRVRLV